MKVLIIAIVTAVFQFTAVAQQLVVPGDFPDPSVVKIGKTYWASATSSNWFPAYPILSSKDLVNWKPRGYVFSQLPEWADYYFWAPEISYDNGRVYVYYTAHKRGGGLCVGIASADKPEGPYRDHGAIICQQVGSIDAFPVRDENGKLFMIWKEDGNSVGKPTPIWIQELNEERTALLGEKKEMFRATEPWEAGLVEGVSIIRKGDYFYAFYAAAGCCGPGCSYGTGIARSKSLMGPWEKYGKNPLMTHDARWKCPGHGTSVEKNGRYYFLYHAYDQKSTVFTGREGLVDEFRFTADGWVEFLKTGQSGTGRQQSLSDRFRGNTLSPNWQWSVLRNVNYSINDGTLQLVSAEGKSGSYLGHRTYSGNYTASISVDVNNSNAEAGIGLIGDDENLLRLSVHKNRIRVVQLRENKETVRLQKEIPAVSSIQLTLTVSNGKDVIWSYSTDGKNYETLNGKPEDAGFLPPWDRPVRVGLIANGFNNQSAFFSKFSLESK